MQIEVVLKRGLVDSNDVATVLLNQSLYKTLSLHEAAIAGVPVLPSLLLIERNDDIVQKRIETWGLPVMLRMDYSTLPKMKPLGGLPLYTMNAVLGTSKFLWREHLYPLLQRNVSRFLDVYSVGALFESTSNIATLEIVGPGFDASDLRLGFTSPQEFLRINLTRSRIIEQRVIAPTEYKKERSRRLKKIKKFLQYVENVNEKYELLSSLDSFSQSTIVKKQSQVVPQKYSTLPRESLLDLLGHCRVLQKRVIRNLPTSSSYVASLSLVKDIGWILWDLYGAWYKR